MRAVLLLQCPDRPGIVAAVGTFVADAGGNVVEADQHSDPAAGLFLQRVEFDVDAIARRRCEPTSRPSRSASRWSGRCTTSRPGRGSRCSCRARAIASPICSCATRSASSRASSWSSRRTTTRTRGLVDASACRSATFPSSSDDARSARRTGTRARRAARRDDARRRRARALHARAAGVARRRLEPADDQHSSLVPAVVRRRASVRAGARARGEGDRRDRALRHARARRRTDHRPTGAAGFAPRRP